MIRTQRSRQVDAVLAEISGDDDAALQPHQLRNQLPDKPQAEQLDATLPAALERPSAGGGRS